MRTPLIGCLRLLVILAPALLASRATFAAATEIEFRYAYAAAATAEKEAAGLRNRWIATETSLTESRKAAERGDFDQAVALAKEAEALAKASVFQATSEKEAWKDLDIR
jgi:hypothetical protein